MFAELLFLIVKFGKLELLWPKCLPFVFEEWNGMDKIERNGMQKKKIFLSMFERIRTKGRGM